METINANILDREYLAAYRQGTPDLLMNSPNSYPLHCGQNELGPDVFYSRRPQLEAATRRDFGVPEIDLSPFSTGAGSIGTDSTSPVSPPHIEACERTMNGRHYIRHPDNSGPFFARGKTYADVNISHANIGTARKGTRQMVQPCDCGAIDCYRSASRRMVSPFEEEMDHHGRLVKPRHAMEPRHLPLAHMTRNRRDHHDDWGNISPQLRDLEPYGLYDHVHGSLEERNYQRSSMVDMQAYHDEYLLARAGLHDLGDPQRHMHIGPNDCSHAWTRIKVSAMCGVGQKGHTCTCCGFLVKWFYYDCYSCGEQVCSSCRFYRRV